jgi:hypothetical protein
MSVNSGWWLVVREADSEAVLELVSKILLRVKKGDPQGLKPAFLVALGGTAEAVPFPNALPKSDL